MENRKPKVRIYLLGKLEIQVDGQRVDGVLSRSKKARMLIGHLLLGRGEPVPVHKLYQVLWSDEEIGNPENALKTLISRTRAMLAGADEALRDCILARRGAYSWNLDIASDVDVFEVERLSREIVACKSLDQAMQDKLDRLLCLYVGEVLPESSQEEWVIAFSLQLEDRYKSAVSWALQLLKQAGEWETIVKICRMSLVVMPFEEQLHAELMHALIMMNRRNDAMAQYKHATNIHLRYLGIQPPSSIQDLYKEIIRADKTLERDIDSISQDLTSKDESSGAFVCEYPIFKDIYQLQLRSLERYNLSSYLAMVMISTVGEEAIEPMLLDETMQKLLTLLKACLRKGDTIARYSASQYALLLQGVTPEAMKIIMDRIKLAFYREFGKATLNLDYRYTPLLLDT